MELITRLLGLASQLSGHHMPEGADAELGHHPGEIYFGATPEDHSQSAEPRFGYDNGWHNNFDKDGTYLGWDWDR